MFIFLKTKNNFAGECVKQHNTEKSSRQWAYMLQTKKVSDWINWCNISWHPALFPLELISPEGSHHKHVCQVRFTPRETTFTASKGKLRNVFDIVKIISSVLSTQKLNFHQNWAWLNLKHHFSYQFAVTASHTRLPKCLQEHKRSSKPSSLPGKYINNVTEEASHKKIDMFLNVMWFIITWQYHH